MGHVSSALRAKDENEKKKKGSLQFKGPVPLKPQHTGKLEM